MIYEPKRVLLQRQDTLSWQSVRFSDFVFFVRKTPLRCGIKEEKGFKVIIMKDQKTDRFGILSLIAGIALLCVILAVTVSSLKATGQRYSNLESTDLSRETESMLYYDDRMFAQIGFGISIIPDEPGNEARLSSFLSSSVHAIDMRIIGCGLLYSMMVSVVLQYFIYSRYHDGIKKYFRGILIASAAPFAAFAAAVLISKGAFGLPFIFPEGREWFLIIAGLLSSAAGSCVLGAVLSVLRRRKTAAVLSVPVVLFLFIAGMNLECRLYTSPTVDSFEYFNETHAYALADDYEGECYYDAEKNAVILDGAEYPPQTVDNPLYFTGWKRICAFLFELADAYSGNGLPLTDAVIEDTDIPLWVPAAYAVKAVMWIALSFLFLKRRRVPAPAGPAAESWEG